MGLCDLQEVPTFDPTLMKKKKSRKSVAFAGEDDNGVVANGGDETPVEGRLSLLFEFLFACCLLHLRTFFNGLAYGYRPGVGDKAREFELREGWLTN